MSNIKKVIEAFWVWLVKSSADPRKIAATVKYGISTLVLFLGYFGFTGEGLDTDQLGDSVGELIVQVVAFVTAAGTVFGAVRKVVITIKDFLKKKPA